MRLAILLVTACAATTAASAQDRLSGEWRGNWMLAGDTMAVTMRVHRDGSTGRYAATFDSERLWVSGIPFDSATVEGCCTVAMTLRGDRTTMTFSGTVRTDTLVGVFREGQREGEFAFTRMAAVGPAFSERAISFVNGSATLAGSLLLPPTGDSLPAVVFLHGSGPEGRWASRFLATQLASHGIAALIFDKRGVGSSSGDWREATLEDLAGDGSAAVAHLRQEPRIAANRIGLHGHSQGGTLAPLVAARAGRIAFVIASAAGGMPLDSIEMFSVLNSVYPLATTGADSAMAESYVRELVAVAYHGGSRQPLDSLAAAVRDKPWFFAPPPPDHAYWSLSRLFGAYDPLAWWAQVNAPVLLIFGADDERVPAAESAARIAGAILRNTEDADVTLRILADADHTFRLPPGPSGWPVTVPDYVPSLLRWLALR